MSDVLIKTFVQDVTQQSRLLRWLPGLAAFAISVGIAAGYLVSQTLRSQVGFLNTVNLIKVTLGSILLIGFGLLFRHSRALHRVLPISIVIIACLIFWNPIISFVYLSEWQFGAEFSPLAKKELVCFGFGTAAALFTGFSLVLLHWRLNLAPMKAHRILTATFAAASGLIAQAFCCGASTLSHLTYAHFGQSAAMIVLVYMLDSFWVKLWEKRAINKSMKYSA